MDSQHSRRNVLRLAGAGAGTLGIAAVTGGGLLAGTAEAAAARSSRPSVVAPEPGVDLWVDLKEADFTSSGKATATVTAGNAGMTAASGPVNIYLFSPFYVNFDPTALPAGSTLVIDNPDPRIPQLLQVSLPASAFPKYSDLVSFTVGLLSVPGGPDEVDDLHAIVVAESDNETQLINNESYGTVGEPVQALNTAPAGANQVNLYYTYQTARLVSGQTRTLEIGAGNLGPSAPVHDAVFVFVSPYLTKIDRSDVSFAARNPTYYHDITDPHVPDVVSIPVAAGTLQPDPNLLEDLLGLNVINIPLVTTGTGQSNRDGKGFLAVGGSPDFDTNLAVGINEIAVLQP